ncbi:hypothetical protein JNUCC1_00484 [Lentibacillus sp. JNUCC-1]|uniref:TIGR04104 family putative zinc finger protein n=1 Tax=Lentibacillus sp. JNUCC-1 TaxID=2654513 RepID=UPI0012E827CE|nr:TIGR04104 family putative zinc finger protein [Lentibacillus sp. JNUCC-1]MUV36680.1 hypothetical protein [Lentibacillus sp. JNUCC-1]
MTKCDECGTRFKWVQIFLNIWSGYRPVPCRVCGTKHKIVYASRVIGSIAIVVPAVIVGFFVPELSMPLRVAGIFGAGFVVSLLLPFVLKYESRYELKGHEKQKDQ